MSTQPNILFILTDQQSWDTLGCYGQPLDVTPHLDRMAGEGVRFEQAFTCQPVCNPARACIQTGKYAAEVGCFRNGIAMPLNVTTLAGLMADAGYETAYIGKWHLASTRGLGDADVDYEAKPVPPERRGGYRDFWLATDVLEYTSNAYDGGIYDGDGNLVPFTGYRVDSQTDFALDYLERREDPRPFFLFLSYVEPHNRHRPICYEGPTGSKERFKDFVPPGDLAGHGGDWQESYPDYLGCCAGIDENVGRIRGKLAELGLADDTLIFYASDHGCHFKTRNPSYKRACHDACARIPLIACGPGFRGGAVVERLAGLIDLPKTVLTAAGTASPSDWRGRPLQEALRPDATDWPEEVFIQISETQVGRAIRTPRWKYSVAAPHTDGRTTPASDLYIEQFLYNLHTDPHEHHNLITDPTHAPLRADLRTRLLRCLRDAGEAEAVIRPAEGA